MQECFIPDYRLLFEHSPSPLLLCGISGVVLDVNLSFCHISGYARNELVEQHCDNVVDFERIVSFANNSEKAKGHSTTFTVELRHKDGGPAPFQAGVYVHQELFTLFLRLDDFARYKTLFDQVFDAMFIIRKENGQIIEVNESAEKTYGYTRIELLRMKNTEVSAEPDRTREATEEKHTTIPVRWHKKKDGTVFPVEILARHFIWKGEEVHLAICRDITERFAAGELLRKAQEKLYSVVNSTLAMICNVDTHFRITAFNDRAAFSMLSVYGAQMTEGVFLPELLPPVESTLLKARLESVLTGKATTSEVRIDQATPPIWVHISYAPTIDPSGRIDGVNITVLDITLRKSQEAELRQKNRDLAEAVATKDKLFSIIAHDVRGPFSGLLGFSQLLAEELEKGNVDNALRFSRIINDIVNKTNDLLQNLLDWANLQRGVYRFAPEYVVLSDLCHETIELYRQAIEQKELSVRCMMRHDLMVYADASMLNIVLRNLLSNAIKFSYKGGEVMLIAREEAEVARIVVRDQGVGMTQIQMNRLFVSKEGISTRGTEKEKGTGIGLILCNELIEIHGGKLSVESQPEKGSTFRFELPLAKV